MFQPIKRARYMESNNILLITYTCVSRKSAVIVRLKASEEGYEVSERFMSILLHHVCRARKKKKNFSHFFNSIKKQQ